MEKQEQFVKEINKEEEREKLLGRGMTNPIILYCDNDVPAECFAEIYDVEPKDTLTDEQIEDIADTLSENASKDTQILREIKYKNPYNVLKDGPGLQEGVATMEINPETGEHKIIATSTTSSNVDLSTIIEKGEDAISMDEDEVNKTFESLGFDQNDIPELLKLISRYKSGEKFSVYNAMPESLKLVVRNLCNSSDRVMVQTVAKDVLKMMINQFNIDKEFIDLQESIKKEMKIPSMITMYSEHLKETMEDDLLKRAAKFEEEGKTDKAELLKQISQAFTDSYTMARQIDVLKHNTSIRIKLRKGLKKYDKICRDINYKYQNTKFKINDVNLIAPILNRLLDKSFTTDDIRKFVVLYYELTKNMLPSRIIEHNFMYYSITNILALDYVDIQDSKFNQDLLNNITEVINMIKEE